MVPVKATLHMYNLEGIWQSTKSLTLEQVGLSRTFLEPGKPYRIQVLYGTELDKNGQTVLKSSPKKGRIFYYESKDCVEANLIYNLSVKGGAIAYFDKKKHLSFEGQGAIAEIPVYTGFEEFLCSISPNNIVLEENEGQNSKEFVDFATSQDLPLEVIEQLKQKGVQTVNDVARLFLDEQKQSHALGVAEKAQSELEENKHRVLFPANFSLKDMGVGGLGVEFEKVFRRLFVSRMFSPSKLTVLGISHVRGLLLVGPPGCGKTLLARQLSKYLKTSKTTVISGPEVVSKWLGESESNIRALFDDAKKEWGKQGERSGLHVIIIDEIDAICGKRRDNGGSGDRTLNSIVNQLLAKMDGVERVNNVLVIGMTNHMNAMDPALLRPGRFELHLEMGHPDEQGRKEILEIHTKSMREGGLFSTKPATSYSGAKNDDDNDKGATTVTTIAKDNDDDDENEVALLSEIAALTEGFTGAELECVVKEACSVAMDRCIDSSDYSLTDESKLELFASDFYDAVDVVKQTKK